MTNKEFFMQTWEAEMQKTLNAVNALPKDMDKLNYRCNEKSRSAAELIGHMLPHAESICDATSSFIADEKTERKFSSIEEAAQYFEKNAKQLLENLKGIDEKAWEEQIVEYQFNGNKIFAYPMSAVFWTVMLDIIHHRGQLSTYYRNMGVRNPNIYGPTAEDMEEMMVAHN
ncbi:MAG TPA: DinB family protein, partial [Hanamia sp.]|nr:DinB family protein [Hanamia sp.]